MRTYKNRPDIEPQVGDIVEHALGEPARVDKINIQEIGNKLANCSFDGVLCLTNPETTNFIRRADTP